MIADAYHVIATAAQQAPQPDLMRTFAMIPIFILIFYFFVIRPQQVKEKNRKAMIAALKKGDRVLTSGGIFGRVVDVKDSYLVIKIANEVKVEVTRDCVTVVEDSADRQQ
ncbi:MAG: preprotein translocase subunit YajC [Candidatus Aureabacteria bacterium]|nr:preprotein translocase subunit YajC [Candidatus Auribacterota bacterium]